MTCPTTLWISLFASSIPSTPRPIDAFLRCYSSSASNPQFSCWPTWHYSPKPFFILWRLCIWSWVLGPSPPVYQWPSSILSWYWTNHAPPPRRSQAKRLHYVAHQVPLKIAGVPSYYQWSYYPSQVLQATGWCGLACFWRYPKAAWSCPPPLLAFKSGCCPRWSCVGHVLGCAWSWGCVGGWLLVYRFCCWAYGWSCPCLRSAIWVLNIDFFTLFIGLFC